MSDSLQPCGLYSPWNSPGQNTGVGSWSLLQGIILTQGLNPGLLFGRQILYHWATGSPISWLPTIKKMRQEIKNNIDSLKFLQGVWGRKYRYYYPLFTYKETVFRRNSLVLQSHHILNLSIRPLARQRWHTHKLGNWRKFNRGLFTKLEAGLGKVTRNGALYCGWLGTWKDKGERTVSATQECATR